MAAMTLAIGYAINMDSWPRESIWFCSVLEKQADSTDHYVSVTYKEKMSNFLNFEY